MKKIRLVLDIEVPDVFTPGAVWHITEQSLTSEFEDRELGWKILNGSATEPSASDPFEVARKKLDKAAELCASLLSDLGECADCQDARRAAYSDATTPGLFRPFCPKHDPQQQTKEVKQ